MSRQSITRQSTHSVPGEWNLGREILSITHNWPWPVLAFLLGSLVGWGISFLSHPIYRAETRINVTYSADAFYRNPDDYKNWQMRQLDLLTSAPDVLAETLARLQAQDAYWQSVSLEDLQDSLHASWRNTGVWRLVAGDQQPERAAQAALTWTGVILETYRAASQAAAEILPYDVQFKAIAYQQARIQARLENLSQVQTALLAQRAALSQAAEQAGDAAPGLDESQRWRLYALAAQAAGSDPVWQSLLETARVEADGAENGGTNSIPEVPPPGSPPAACLPWIDSVLATISAEMETLPGQAAALDTQRTKLFEQYQQTITRSRGLSSTLVVDWPFSGIWQTEVVRPSGLMILVGGLLGLLAWGVFWLVRLTLYAPGSTRPGRGG